MSFPTSTRVAARTNTSLSATSTVMTNSTIDEELENDEEPLDVRPGLATHASPAGFMPQPFPFVSPLASNSRWLSGEQSLIHEICFKMGSGSSVAGDLTHNTGQRVTCRSIMPMKPDSSDEHEPPVDAELVHLSDERTDSVTLWDRLSPSVRDAMYLDARLSDGSRLLLAVSCHSPPRERALRRHSLPASMSSPPRLSARSQTSSPAILVPTYATAVSGKTTFALPPVPTLDDVDDSVYSVAFPPPVFVASPKRKKIHLPALLPQETLHSEWLLATPSLRIPCPYKGPWAYANIRGCYISDSLQETIQFRLHYAGNHNPIIRNHGQYTKEASAEYTVL